MPGGNAYRPGDILTTMSGQTVEVLNTDAEGRLVLWDAPHLCGPLRSRDRDRRGNLTGAVSSPWATTPLACWRTTTPGPRAAGTPPSRPGSRLAPALFDEYQEQLESPFAGHGQHRRSPGRHHHRPQPSCRASPRSTTGPTWISPGPPGKAAREKGSTGRPVPLLTQFLLNRAGVADVEDKE